MSDFSHRHRSSPGQKLGQRAFVVRVQMLNQDESHARINWQILEQLGKSFQPASRSANPYNGKMLSSLAIKRQCPGLNSTTRFITSRRSYNQASAGTLLTFMFYSFLHGTFQKVP